MVNKCIYLKDDTKELFKKARLIILQKDNTIDKLTDEKTINYVLKKFIEINT